jgi:hypothetical protein
MVSRTELINSSPVTEVDDWNSVPSGGGRTEVSAGVSRVGCSPATSHSTDYGVNGQTRSESASFWEST